MAFWKRLGRHTSIVDSREKASASTTTIQAGQVRVNSLEDQHGLFILHDQDPQNPKAIDIIAMHGLNGHYEKTWQAKSHSGKYVNWLRDFLAQQIPNARIMSYGYSSTVAYSKSVANIDTFAGQLLEDIRCLRIT